MRIDQSVTDEQLNSIIGDARTELKRRATSDDPFTPIKGQETCKRALIVAAVQGHTVGVYGPHGTGKSMLVDAGRALGVPVVEGLPCPCGNFIDPISACACTTDAISKHQRQLLKTVGQSDLHIECPSVPSHELLSKRHGTTTAVAREQIERAGELPDKAKLGTGCAEIIKQVIAELGLSAATLDTCLSVAQSIAALSQSDEIRVEHLLEAVQYRSLNRLLG